MSNFIDREDLYDSRHPEFRERTRNRLTTLREKGMEEVGVAEFGIRGVMSGLYIERVWHYSDEDFNDYMNWVDEMKAKKEINV